MAEPQYTPVRLCAAPGCARPTRGGRRFCPMHYCRLRKFGSFDLPDSDPDLPGEEWRPVVGWEELYAVSSFGRVRTLVNRNGSRAGKIKRANVPEGNGEYPAVRFKHGPRRQIRHVHILVAAAFLGPCPMGHEVNHKDGIKTNPRLDNLEYATRLENAAHASRMGLTCRGERRPGAKLREDDVRAIRRLRSEGATFRAIAERYGIHRQAAANVVNGRSWKHVA